MKNTTSLRKLQVRVTARDFNALKNQGSDLFDHLENAWGTNGAAIATKVIANGGWADLELADIRTGLDVQSGVDALFDNFELSIPKTGEPLFDFLAKEYLGFIIQ